MKIEYDSEVDIMYINLREAKIDESDEVSDGVIVDYDHDGKPGRNRNSRRFPTSGRHPEQGRTGRRRALYLIASNSRGVM